MKLIATITQGENKGAQVYVQQEYRTGNTLVMIDYTVGGKLFCAYIGQFEIMDTREC